MAQIRQKGYTYTRNGKRVHVAGHLRKDTGKPGRTPKSQQFGVEAREGALGGWSKDKSPAERHRILRGQVARHGCSNSSPLELPRQRYCRRTDAKGCALGHGILEA